MQAATASSVSASGALDNFPPGLLHKGHKSLGVRTMATWVVW